MSTIGNHAPLGAWTSLPRGTTRIIYQGTPYEVYKTDAYSGNVAIGWLWQVTAFGTETFICQVRRGVSGEWWAGPTGWDWNVIDDIAETLRIILQGGYDSELPAEAQGAKPASESGNE